MPTGRNGAASFSSRGSERPVVFQKYFKSGSRTYASQIKIANNGKRYLALTEGFRDPETQEVKKHVIRVFEDDLKEFFSMLQETVVYLRAKRDPASEADIIASAAAAAKPRPVVAMKPPVASSPAVTAPARPVARPVQPKTAVPSRTNGGSATARTNGGPATVSRTNGAPAAKAKIQPKAIPASRPAARTPVRGKTR